MVFVLGWQKQEIEGLVCKHGIKKSHVTCACPRRHRGEHRSLCYRKGGQFFGTKGCFRGKTEYQGIQSTPFQHPKVTMLALDTRVGLPHIEAHFYTYIPIPMC